jgi:hypothetical protein
VLLVHLFQGPENCKTLISCESNPEVISTPMQQAKRQKYIFRRLGFLYHLTGSSAAICVTIGSENPDALGTATGIWMCGAIMKTQPRLKVLSGSLSRFCLWFCDDSREEEVEEIIYLSFTVLDCHIKCGVEVRPDVWLHSA